MLRTIVIILYFMFCTCAYSTESSQALNKKQNTAIKAVLFDTFGTVVDWRGTMITEFSVLFKKKKITEVTCETFIEALVSAYAENMSKISEHKIPFATVDELNKIALEETLKSYNIFEKFTEKERHNMWMVWHRLNAWPDSAPGLVQLKKHFIIGTLSNGNIKLLVDLSKRAKLDWDVILSGEIFSRYKPDPLVYQSAAKLLNLNPSEILLVASHKYDLEAAHQCGFKTAYIFRPLEFGTVQPDQIAHDNEFDFVTTSITQLAALLR
jgi:2-haloacid dehalogenase